MLIECVERLHVAIEAWGQMALDPPDNPNPLHLGLPWLLICIISPKYHAIPVFQPNYYVLDDHLLHLFLEKCYLPVPNRRAQNHPGYAYNHELLHANHLHNRRRRSTHPLKPFRRYNRRRPLKAPYILLGFHRNRCQRIRHHHVLNHNLLRLHGHARVHRVSP